MVCMDSDPTDALKDELELMDVSEINALYPPTYIGGVYLDEIGDVLSDVDYSRDPIRITIEPETADADDFRYGVEFTQLTYGDNELRASVSESKAGYVAGKLGELECVVDRVLPGVIKHEAEITLFVEAHETTIEAEDGTTNTEDRVPESVYETIDKHDCSLTKVIFHPAGRGYGFPVFELEVSVE